MLKKHAILIGIIISIILLVVAMLYYPGGSQSDKNSVGYDWKQNYLSNLFPEKALNGQNNPARIWAMGGVFFLCTASALFFYRFSGKIPPGSSAKLIRYLGPGAMAATFLVVTPLHDLMVTISGTGTLACMFYITIFLLTSKLLFMKIFSVVCLLSAYICSYLYYTRSHLELLPVMQKVSLLLTIFLVLCLEYFTTSADFPIKKTSVTKQG